MLSTYYILRLILKWDNLPGSVAEIFSSSLADAISPL